MNLILKDSELHSGVRKRYHEQCAAYMNAVDQLQKHIKVGEVEIVSLQTYNPRLDIQTPVWYEVKSYGEKRGYKVVNECEFFSSHYIGRYMHNGYAIIIEPRFGNIFNYLVNYATNIYISNDENEVSFIAEHNSYWLIALLWKAMLNKALVEGQIPKEYQVETKNRRSYRGHLAMAKHIHANLCDATKFFCSYKKLSMDNTINRTIRTVYKVLSSLNLNTIVSEFEAYDKYLCSMGVFSEISDVKEIDNIRYTRLNAAYKPVMELSRTILSNYKAESSDNNSSENGISYFIDIAELWEMYLLKLLQNNLPSKYHVYSPNSGLGEYLLENGMRAIRPDIIIEKDGRVLVIIDAKYKYYEQFGSTSKYGVSREDLYQMTTYLHHYGKDDASIVGLFTAPSACGDNDIHTFSQKKNHRIGLVNLNIVDNDNNMELLHRSEAAYIGSINKILSAL